MNKDFLEISGWVVAVLSLIVNILQYFKNAELKKQASTQKVGDNSKATQQTHSGTGHNISSGRDVNL